MQALDFRLDTKHVSEVAKAVCSHVTVQDGIVFDIDAMQIEQIRDEDEYSGLRVSLPALLGRARIAIKLDISTGDPIWPEPERIELPSMLGGVVAMHGHPLVTVIAEKTVTMLQRGTTSTRWRDLLDVAILADRFEFRAGDVIKASMQVAAHRGVELRALRPVMDGYSSIGQAKWAAWRRKLKVDSAGRTSTSRLSSCSRSSSQSSTGRPRTNNDGTPMRVHGCRRLQKRRYHAYGTEPLRPQFYLARPGHSRASVGHHR